MSLKLSKLPTRTPVKLTVSMSPDLNETLTQYAKTYSETYGETESVPDLIPFMLEQFLASDRGFAKALKQRKAAPTAAVSPPAPRTLRVASQA